MCLTFEVAVSVDKLLEQEFSVYGQNILVIPNVDNIPIKKLVPYHQVLVTFSFNTPGVNLLNHSTCFKEINRLYGFFNNYGKIVDLNLEFMPACIVVTYTRHESVLDILAKSKLSVILIINFRDIDLYQQHSR